MDKKIFDFGGAKAFIKETIKKSDENSILILQVPKYLIDEAAWEIEANLSDPGMRQAISIDVHKYTRFRGVDEMSPIDIIVNESPEAKDKFQQQELSRVSDEAILAGIKMFDFIQKETFKNLYFIYGVAYEDWSKWQRFLTDFKRNIKDNNVDDHPNLLLLAPEGVSEADLTYVSGIEGYVRWENAVTSCDIDCYAEELAGPARSIIEKFARATTVEFAGTDLKLLKQLLEYDIETQFNPVSKLIEEKDAISAQGTIAWENGSVDYWSNEMRLGTAQLVNLDLESELNHRVWRSQTAIAMKFSDTIRRALISKYQYHLNTLVSSTKPIETRYGRMKTDPYSLELSELLVLNKRAEREHGTFLSNADFKLADEARSLRINAAHITPIKYEEIESVLRLWENNPIQNFIPHATGWNWPRKENKIVLTVGPSKSGKSTWANNQEGRVVSYQTIRNKAGKKADSLPESIIFIKVMTEFANEMMSGNDVIVDHDFLEAKLREYFIQNIPKDLTIQYAIINRPLEDKLDGAKGSQKEKIESEEKIFDNQFKLIVGSEEGNRVEILDLRVGPRQ